VVCEICGTNKATRLCDMPRAIVIDSTVGVPTGHYMTCDKNLCSNCSIQLNGQIDICPDCLRQLNQIKYHIRPPEEIELCGLVQEYGLPIQVNGLCEGFLKPIENEIHEKCKVCKFNFMWEGN
jgi:hypothetical protein